MERMGATVRPRDVRTERKGNSESWRKHRLGCHFQFFQFRLLEPLGFRPSVLEPYFHLCLCQVEGAGELCALGDGEVLLLAELPLQGQELGRGERGPGLSVGFVLPQGTGRRTQPSCEKKERMFVRFPACKTGGAA